LLIGVGFCYFFAVDVTCFVLWTYAAALLPFGYFVHTGDVGQRLAFRVIATVVVLSIVAPWPYLRRMDRTVVVSAAVESADPVGPCDCVRLVADSQQVRDAGGFDVEGGLEWEICAEELSDWINSKAKGDAIETEWEVTYGSEYLQSWRLFSYGLERVAGRDALKLGGWQCSE
jgi:hypothetical protein